MTTLEFKAALKEYIALGGTAYLDQFNKELKKRHPAQYWRKKLAWELKKLKSKSKKVIRIAKEKAVETKQREILGGVPLVKIKPVDSVPVEQQFLNAPFSIRLIRTEYVNLKKEQAAIHARLRMTPPIERFAACYRILEIAKKLDEIWDKIRHWRKTGEEPSGELSKNVVQMVLDKYKRHKTLRTDITKYQKKLKGNISEEEKERYEGYLVNYKEEIAAIEKELGL